jgi:aconitate hydratase
MGVLPCELPKGLTTANLKLEGDERISVTGIPEMTEANATLKLTIEKANGNQQTLDIYTRIDTKEELRYYQNGGILQTVLRQMAKEDQ